MHKNSYLLMPACDEGNGTGHLRRMIALYKDLKKSSAAAIFISGTQIPEIHKKLLDISVEQNDIYISAFPKERIWDFIVVDFRSIPDDLIKNLLGKGFLIGIDEGSPNRSSFNYLIDIIPSLDSFIKPNISTIGLMNLPERREYGSLFLQKKILISFGGEDPAGLTGILLEFIKKNNFFPESELTVAGNIETYKYPQSVKILNNRNNLKDFLNDYDLIFTSFGLTAFESLASGVPFILLNPTPYHKKLSKKCGFFEIGVKKPNRKKLEKYISTWQNYKNLQNKYIPKEYTKLSDLILSINKTESICPVCHNICNLKDIVYRFETRNFYKCPVCQITYQVNYSNIEDSYKEAYFFEDYKKQYGKTYLEDFDNIQVHAKARLEIINGIRPVKVGDHNNSSLLDIGCAYGPFLVESLRYGYLPQGVEIIPEAAAYIRSEFGFGVFTGAFEDAVFARQFDVVTMWYVIEHFTDPHLILTKVNSILKIGGIFSFSTPNSTGISSRVNLLGFLKNSPQDHITIWNPKISDVVLKRYGFKIKRIRITGHHPERFSGFNNKRSKIIYKIINLISRILNLGDTFEVYAEKVNEIYARK